MVAAGIVACERIQGQDIAGDMSRWLQPQCIMAQDKEKGKLEDNRSKVIERTKAIIEQAGKMRNAPVGATSCLLWQATLLLFTLGRPQKVLRVIRPSGLQERQTHPPLGGWQPHDFGSLNMQIDACRTAWSEAR